MPGITNILTATGPLPITANFNADTDIAVLFYVTGSSFTAVGGNVGVDVYLDGEQIGWAAVFSSETESHKALVASMLLAKMSGGPHTLELRPLAFTNSTADGNDLFSVSMYDVGDTMPFVWNFHGGIPSYNSFMSDVYGEALLFYCGSAYQSSPGGGGISVVLDGTPVDSSSVFMNAGNIHYAFPPHMVPLKLTPGPHKIGFSMTTGDIQSDGNDFYSMAVIY